MPLRIVIIGGGVIGSATACFLARDHGAEVTVIERDPSYRIASSALSASSIRQQFSQPVNIALSRASFEFLRTAGTELAIGAECPDIALRESGYLYLATDGGARALRENHARQRRAGADILLLEPAALRDRYPWLHIDDLALAALGRAGEGWFDGYALLQAFRHKAIACGARYVSADAIGFECAGNAVRGVIARDGVRYACDAALIAAGAWSAPLAAELGCALPVRARKRDVFVLRSPAHLPECPLVVDPSGFWLRPEGAGYLCGAPPRGADADDQPLRAIDYGLFDEAIWPALAHRIPAFEVARVVSAWAGYYEMNTFDRNGIVGVLPGWRNVLVAAGFSGHGMQQAPAVGREIAQFMVAGRYTMEELEALSPQRIIDARPLPEANVI